VIQAAVHAAGLSEAVLVNWLSLREWYGRQLWWAGWPVLSLPAGGCGQDFFEDGKPHVRVSGCPL
jgi:hypothetical protein